MNILIIGDPTGVHSKIALRKYLAEDITVWENDSRHIYTINQICGRINVTTDLDSLDKMHFDVCIGNPPYSDRSKMSDANGGGFPVNMDSKFFLKCIEVSDKVSLIIRAKHFSKVESRFRKTLFGSGKLVEIRHLPKETFPTILNTETCVVTWDINHDGPCKVTYEDGTVVDRDLTENDVIKLNNPNYVAEVDNNMAHRFMCGDLKRNRIVDVDDGVELIEIMGRTNQPMVTRTINAEQTIKGRNKHGVVMNLNGNWDGFGKMEIKPFESAISKQIIMLETSSHEESVELLNYLKSDKVKEQIKTLKVSFCNSKYLFSMIKDFK